MERRPKMTMRDRVTFVVFAASCQYLGFNLIGSAVYEAQQLKNGEKIHCVEPKIQWLTCIREYITNLKKAQEQNK